MGYRIKFAGSFEQELKKLARKYRSLTEEAAELIAALKISPRTGTSLGQNCYKVRLKIASKGGGKSGGARVITCVLAVRETVYLLSIYDKAEQDSISDKRLAELLAALPVS